MKFNAELNKDSLKSDYYEKKPYIIPGVAILISVILFIMLIIPQLLNFSTKINDIERENQKLNTIENSVNIAANANVAKLDDDIQTISRTLPQIKNFEKILGSISTAASLSNTLILSFQFQNVETNNIGQKDVPALNFKVVIFGGPEVASLFIEELYKLNPISEVTSVKTDEGLSTLDVLFYYKPIETLNQEQVIELKNLTNEQVSIINTVGEWPNIDAPSIFNITSESSVSATGRSSPF